MTLVMLLTVDGLFIYLIFRRQRWLLDLRCVNLFLWEVLSSFSLQASIGKESLHSLCLSPQRNYSVAWFHIQIVVFSHLKNTATLLPVILQAIFFFHAFWQRTVWGGVRVRLEDCFFFEYSPLVHNTHNKSNSIKDIKIFTECDCSECKQIFYAIFGICLLCL